MIEKDYSWFDFSRFGMFIHWGVYSMGARYTWLKSHERMTDAEYDRYVKHFDPDMFNPKEWARLARRAGMRYVVFTSKHHDGFCMFDSKVTDYKYKEQDLLRAVIDAFRAEGLKIGVYYSLPDWHHPNYPRDARHPQRSEPNEVDFMPYRAYLHAQVREILTNYGKIDMMWFDGSYLETMHIWDMPALAAMARELQPGLLISRLPGFDDFDTPEQNIPQQGLFDEKGNPKHWEGCQVLHGEWCYIRDKKWKTVPELIQMLIRHVSRGGNLLLNVGPTSRGALDNHTVSLLNGLGEWMEWHQRAIYGCYGAPAEFPEPEFCRYTWNPERRCLYLHLFSWPDRRIDLLNLAGKVEYAQLLCDGSEITFTETLPVDDSLDAPARVNNAKAPAPGSLRLALPVECPEGCPVPVIELFLR